MISQSISVFFIVFFFSFLQEEGDEDMMFKMVFVVNMELSMGVGKVDIIYYNSQIYSVLNIEAIDTERWTKDHYVISDASLIIIRKVFHLMNNVKPITIQCLLSNMSHSVLGTDRMKLLNKEINNNTFLSSYYSKYYVI